MKLTGFDADHVLLVLSRNELRAMGQALNEVCNGLRVVDFQIKMGSDKIETEGILDEIIPIYRKMKKSGNQDVEMNFSRRDLRAIIGAFEEVCKEIDAIDFSTRMGAQRSEVDQILAEIVPIYHQMKLM
ncbi:MAG: hypothetical protein HY913_18930 [Desulfomonile tiedjei]|nr:hypothetical protein [Desulfomonile tiedjei]